MRLIKTSKKTPLLLALLFVATFAIQLSPISQPVSAVTYDIGDTGPAGGLIFHIDGDTYYEVAPSGWNGGGDPLAEWGCFGQVVLGADGTAIGTGEQNTADIVAFHDNPANFDGNDYYTYGGDYGTIGCYSFNNGTVAAKLASDLTLGGAEDWFLPSRDELDAMYDNLHTQALGGFADSIYWSSSESSSTSAWEQSFSSGNQSIGPAKDNSNYVRPVRVFTETAGPSATDSTTITAQLAPTISLATSGSVDFSILPTAAGSLSSDSDTVLVSTNNSSGYTLSFQSDEQFAELNNFVGDQWLMRQNGTITTPNPMETNNWGFRIDGLGGFGGGTTLEDNVATSAYTWAGAPEPGSPETIKTTATTASNDPTVVWYGAKVDTDQQADDYTGTVTYTAVTN